MVFYYTYRVLVSNCRYIIKNNQEKGVVKNTMSSLPDYNNPPINEVVFGIQFKQLDLLNTPHIGFFWEKLSREDYLEYKEMPILPHIVESFGSSIKQSPQISIFDRPPLPRLFFISKVKNHLIQLQQDRFLTLLIKNKRGRGGRSKMLI